MLRGRAAGGRATGSLREEDPLVFEYADLLVSAHLRLHYDGQEIREGGSLLLVMRARITDIPRDHVVIRTAMTQGSRYPYTSVCLIPPKAHSHHAGTLYTYATLLAKTMTPEELDLALRSMVQHYHHLPLELGAPNVDPERRLSRTKALHPTVAASQDPAPASSRADSARDTPRRPTARRQRQAEQVRRPTANRRSSAAVDDARLSRVLDRLNSMVGLQQVKAQITQLTHVTKFAAARATAGMTDVSHAPHLVFVGNPGTGKTTVAQYVFEAYCALGVLHGGKFVAVDRSQLVGEFVGKTAIKTRSACRSALGGMLFIDEAYSLDDGDRRGYGSEAIETLMIEMERHRGELTVIVAGYPDRMARFLLSNPGLASRFDATVEFPDYTAEELVEVFIHVAGSRSFTLQDGCRDLLHRSTPRLDRGESFGNAREMRKWVDAAIAEQAIEWVAQEMAEPDALTTISLVALERALARVLRGGGAADGPPAVGYL